MREQCAMRCGRGWWHDPLLAPLGGGKTRREQTDGRRFHIAFAAGDLTSKAPAWVCSHSQCFIKQLWRIEKRIAVQTAKPGKFRVLQTWNGPKNTNLLTVF